MAEPLVARIPESVALAGDYIIRVTAVDSATGAIVEGVNVSNVTVTALDVATRETVETIVTETPTVTPPPSVPPPPPVPSGAVDVTYTVAGTTITLHWTAVSGA